MAPRKTPPFRADHVGSLLRPPRLLAARERAARGEIGAEDLRAVEDAAIRDAVALQEGLDLQGVTDGEFRRTFFHIDFLQRFEGVSVAETGIAAHFHREDGALDFAPPRISVTGKLRRPGPVFGEDFSFLAGVTRRAPKETIPSPGMAHFRGGRGAVDKAAYPDKLALVAELADEVWGTG